MSPERGALTPGPSGSVGTLRDPTLRLMDLADRVGEALGDGYHVLGHAGEGGMGMVFRAHDKRHDREVAVKVMRRELGIGRDAERFLKEIRLTARLQHPNIVSLFDSGASGTLVYYVMPFIEGESLRSVLRRQGRLSLGEALHLAGDIAGALDYAHGKGIVHRDLKPDNILITAGRAMLADFGIAGAVADFAQADRFTPPEATAGTPAYMSPEQCAGNQALDARSDVYALGCVLYEMLAGEPPFSGRTAQVIMARHVSERVPAVDVLRPDVPPHVARVVERALAKAPGDRFASARGLADALAERDPRSARTRWWLAAGATAAVAGIVFVSTRASIPIDRNRIAIFPLVERQLVADERGSGAAVSVLLTAALEHADPLRSLDMYDLLPAAQQENPVSLGAAQRRALARQAGAGHYINGFVQGHGDSMTVGLALYSVEGDSIIDQESASGDRSTPVHRLGVDAVRALLPSLVDPGRIVDLTPLRNRRAGAVALFVQGEREYRHSSFQRAATFYRRALEEDSALVIAAIKGALASYWQDHGASIELARYAASRDSLLPARYAAFARGLSAYADGQLERADSAFAVANRAAPGWPEAAMQRAEAHYHLAPLRGLSDSIAEAGFRLAAMDSGFSPPLIHLTEIAVRANRIDEANGLMRRLTAMHPASDAIDHLPIMRDCVRDGPANFRWKEQIDRRLVAVYKAGKALAATGSQLPCAEAAFRSLLRFAPDTGAWQWGTSVGLMSVLAAERRTPELVKLVDSVSQAGRLQVLMTAYPLLEAAGLAVDERATAVDSFARARWGPELGKLSADRRLEWLQWLFGTWHARRGNRAIVASLREALTKANVSAPHPITRLFQDALDARLRLASGDTANAIRLLAGLHAVVPRDSLTWSMVMPFAPERLLLAELLLARREYVEAIQVANVFDHPEPMVFVAFLPASLSIRQRAAQALGRREVAAQYGARLEQLTRAAPARSSK